MVAAIAFTTRSNELLSGNDPAQQARALQAVSGAASIQEVVDRLNFYDGWDRPEVDEATTILAQFPRSVDRGLLAVLQSALERGIPVNMEWEQSELIGFLVNETDNGDLVNIVLNTPIP